MIRKTQILIGLLLFTYAVAMAQSTESETTPPKKGSEQTTTPLTPVLPAHSIASETGERPKVDYAASPRPQYKIAEIQVLGADNLDEEVIIQVSRLSVGDLIEVPGDDITFAVKRLYKQRLFSNVSITARKIVGSDIYLNIHLTERPKLSKINYTGATKSEREKLEKKINILSGQQVTKNLLNQIDYLVKDYYKGKGFYSMGVEVSQEDDPEAEDAVIINVAIDRNSKVKISNIYIEGNDEVKAGVLKHAMKKTKEKKIKYILRSSNYIAKEFKDDKVKLVNKYNELGYRDAIIVADSVVPNADNSRVDIYLDIEEGNKYFFNKINWIGNTVYPNHLLSRSLGIVSGDSYNKTLLDKRISTDDDAVQNLYMNNGYLFSQIVPVEIVRGKDSIDLELRVIEGKQATLNRVEIKGNSKTHEHVARRELYTYPGDLFSREKLMRSYRELAQLGHFDPETINPDVRPNPENATVDIIYELEEKSNDQVEISGGYGGGTVIGSIGLRFSNFSIRNLFNREAWSPLPTGDGQTLSLRAQTNGKYYSSYNISFIEPWLGGKKPNSLSISAYMSNQTSLSSSFSVANDNYNPDGDHEFTVYGASVGLGRRLKWPDNYFILNNSLSFQRYELDNWAGFYQFATGNSNIISLNTTLRRSSIDNPLYTRRGSDFTLGLQITPPYSLFDDRNYALEDDATKYEWIEYHKWTFKGKVYKPLSRDNKLVLYTGAEYGFLGYFDEDKRSPFEGFVVGGDGISGYRQYGSDLIAVRGYENNSLTPLDPKGNRSIGNLYSKMSLEVRYPLSLAQSATIYVLGFAEAGNSWYEFKDFEPFNLYRSVGAGARIYLPMFGLLGIDYGYGFDQVPGNPGASGGQFHFILGQQF